jgi:hypothetical protein
VTEAENSRGALEQRSLQDLERGARWVAWFHELDAWTEYWDIYHP